MSNDEKTAITIKVESSYVVWMAQVAKKRGISTEEYITERIEKYCEGQLEKIEVRAIH